MAKIAMRSFQGEIPRLSANLLPEEAAQQSLFVDHSRGHLTPLKGGLELKTNGIGGWTAGGAPINSMYSLEGVGWYTTSVSGVEYFRSPVIDEQFNRIYYLESGVLKVAQWDISHTAGGPPASSVKVGVPTPTAAPTLSLIDLSTLPDYPSATFTFSYWYDNGGVRFQTFNPSVTTIVALKQYRFTVVPPDINEDDPTLGTPADSTLVGQVELKDGTSLLFRISTSYGSAIASRTQALPGGLEISLSKVDETTYDFILSWGVVETRAYLYTALNTFNEESPPSPAALISPTYIQNVSINAPKPVATGYQPLQSQVRIYRTFGGTAAYLKIEATYTGFGDLYQDASHKASNVGFALASAGWVQPPATMGGLKIMPNGWFAAFNGNTLYMSEPYHPHTWQYNTSFPTGIRGICPGAQGLVVTTFDETYLVTGPHPATAMPVKIPIPVGGVSQLGMVSIEGMVAFLSQEGIVLVEGTQGSLGFSQKLFTRADWRARYGSILTGMRLSYHAGFLIASSSTATSNGDYGFAVRIDEAAGQYTRYNAPISTTARVPVLDSLYFSTTDDGVGAKNVYEFNAGSAQTYTWWSKDFVFPDYTSFGAFYIRASGFVEITFYLDGVQFFHTTASGTMYGRMPSGSGLRWSVKFSNTTADIYEFILAQTMGELSAA